MAQKTNCEINGIKYFQLYANLGRNADGSIIRKKVYGRNKSDALAKKEALEEEYKKKINSHTRTMRVDQVMHDYLYDIVINEVKLSTHNRYEGIYDLYIKKNPLSKERQNPVGSALIGNIERMDIIKYYNALRKIGKSESQIFNLNKLLNKFFNYCIDERALEHNPCRRIKIKVEPQNKEPHITTAAEIKRLRKVIQGNRDECLIILGYSTGMREGEMLALDWSDIDMKKCEINVSKTLAYLKKDGKYQYVITPPKTDDSIRIVPYPSEVNDYLLQHKARLRIEKEKAGPLYMDIGEKVFKSANGNYINANNFLKRYKRLLKAADIEVAKFHAARGSYSSILFEKGAALETVSKILGHKNSKITKQHYLRISNELKHKEADKIKDILA